MSERVDLTDLTLPQLVRLLQLKSWLGIIAIGISVFTGGVAFASFLGIRPEPAELRELSSDLRDAKNSLGSAKAEASQLKGQLAEVSSELQELQRRNDELNGESEGVKEELQASLVSLERARSNVSDISGELTSVQDAMSVVQSELTACVQGEEELQADLNRCIAQIANSIPGLWLVHQGDGNGYPSGNNGDVANHDERSNWDSTHYRSEACPQRGGPRVDENYAKRKCGDARAAGPLGVLDVGGGTCGHAMYVFACMP